ncbi:uncharacterized protein [Solanum lycopersicum]|uniref:uncharacterized protein n=1 Tax=Solanum lycopersicum TaxID=4081 RepID=UPI003749D886
MKIECNIVVQLPQDLSYKKREDLCAFTIPCTVGSLHFAEALCYLEAIINLMTLSIYKKLGLGDPKPTDIQLQMVDRTVKIPLGILHDVLVKVESFIFQVDFVILYCKVDFEVPIVLVWTFLSIGRALGYMKKGQMKFWLNNKEVTFNISRSMKKSGELPFMVGDFVLLDSSRFRWLLGKLNYKCTGLYVITQDSILEQLN